MSLRSRQCDDVCRCITWMRKTPAWNIVPITIGSKPSEWKSSGLRCVKRVWWFTGNQGKTRAEKGVLVGVLEAVTGWEFGERLGPDVALLHGAVQPVEGRVERS